MTMLRYSLILLLVNIYGRSLGVPVPKQNSNGKNILIGNLLNELSKQCKNEFVVSQIESKNSTCDVEPNYHIVNLQCLMFYDANRLLCNLSTANLGPDFTAKISEKQDPSAFCSEASHFSASLTSYQQMLTTVFQSPDGCKRVCADDDIRTGDTNFFCKYFKWSLLKLQDIHKPAHESAPTFSAGSGAPSDTQKGVATAIEVSQPDEQAKKTSDIAESNTQLVKAEEPNQHTSESAKQESSSTSQLTGSLKPENPNLEKTYVDSTKKSTLKPVPNIETADKPQENYPVDPIDPETHDGGVEAGIDTNPGEIKDPDSSFHQIETPGQKISVGNEDTDDINMDDDGTKDASDDDDTIVGDFEVKQEQETKKSSKGLETQVSLNGDAAQREIFPNADGFTEDDDHFFPFFLTAVIVAVVLYVLYHNKKVVGKMFFGLLVEGRQPGRRRNSRGHAYRRLDTLEQAMSANTPAPPSKIIY